MVSTEHMTLADLHMYNYNNASSICIAPMSHGVKASRVVGVNVLWKVSKVELHPTPRDHSNYQTVVRVSSHYTTSS